MKNTNILSELYKGLIGVKSWLSRGFVLISALFTLAVGNVWAEYNYNWYGNVFFRAPDDWDLSTYSHVQIGLARTTDTNTSTYTWFFAEMDRVGTTRLFYKYVGADHSTWKQNEYVFFTANSSNQSAGDRKVNSLSCYTTPKNYGFCNNDNPYLFNPSSEGNGAAVSGSYSSTGSSYSDRRDDLLKKTQRANIYTNGSSSKTGGSVRIDGYYLTSNTAVSTSYVTNSSNTYASYNAAIGTPVTLTATPSTGYQFDGWYDSGTGGSLVSSSNPYSYTCTGAKTVYARFAKTSTITFDQQSGTGGSANVTATYGLAMPSATMPTRNGYIFEGYYDNESGGTQYYTSSGTSARTWDKASNTTLYAHWTPIWQLYNNTTHIGDFEYISDYEYTLTVTLSSSNAEQMHFKKDGTTFYYTGADNPTTTNNTLVSGDGMISYATMGLSNREYTLIIRSDNSGTSWYLRATSGATYSVTYNGNSQTSGSAPVDGSSPYEAGANVTVLGNTGNLSKTGYTFSGWNTQADGNGTNYAVGSTISSIAANKILYAKWTENMTTVTVNVNPLGAGTLTVDASAFTPGNTTTAGVTTSHSVVATANSGKVFLDWSTSGNATGTNTTNTFTLNGNGNGGTGTITANFGVSTGWYMEGTDFGGWGGDNCSSLPTTYPFSRPYRDQANTYYIPVTLKSSSYFKVHYGDGCSNVYNFGSSSSNVTVSKNNVYNLTADASHSGTVSSTMSDVWVVLNTSTKKFWVQDPATYYTITIENGSSGNILSGTEGTITIKSNNLGNFDTKQFASGETIKLSVSAKSGYYIDDITIGGNSIASDVYTASYNGTATMPAGDATLTVTYKRIYTVIYGVGTSYTSMGSVSTSPDITSGNNVIAGTSITFTATPNLGYKFVGWYANAACTGDAVSTNASYSIASLGANTTLYAKFDYRDLYIHNDWTSNWGTPVAMTQSTANRAVYTYTYDNMGALASAQVPSGAWDTGYHFRIMNAANGENGYLAYNYDGVQTPTYSGSVDAVHKTADINPTIEFGLTQKSFVTITLTLQEAANPTVNIAADPYYTITTATGGSGAAGITISPASVEARSGANSAEITATIDPGYTFVNWTAGGTITINSENNTTTTIRATGAGTLTANATANSYTVHFYGNGNTGGSMDDMPARTYGVAFNLTANGFTKTGYSFDGWATTADGAVVHADEANVSNLTTENNGTAQLYAKWSPVAYTVTLDGDEEHNKTAGNYALSGGTATFDATLPSFTGTLPTAADGYAFMGFYSEQNGNGVQVIEASGEWIATAAGYTFGGNWVHEGNTTLYAYFKQAEITAITLNAGAFEPVEEGEGYVVANPTIAPTPTGTTMICWEMLYDNDNPVPAGHEAIDDHDGSHPNRVKFSIAGLAAGSYKIRATLHTGDGACGTGTTLSVEEASFTIASDFTVTVQYKCGDVTIQSSSTSPGKPLVGTEITAPDIIGYTFSKWKAGDGVTIDGADASGEKTTATINYTANYNGTLTAIYTKKNVIYFYNTLGWSDVYVYFYSSDKYWVEDHIAGQGCGTGSDQNYEVDGSKAYYRGYHGHMTQIAGTNIWYYDYEAEHGAKDGGEIKGYDDVVFVETEQNNYKFFYNNKASCRGDFKHSLSMFVPLDNVTKTKNGTKYYNDGYWMNYPENTGYTLRIYPAWNADKSSGASKEYFFPYSADLKMPLKLDVEFNYTGKAWFMIYRNDNRFLGKNYSMTQADHVTDLSSGSNDKIELNTSAAGVYTFTLSFHDNNGDGTYKYYIDVDYPVGVGDYRILYNDRDTWSQGAAHSASWWHESNIIRKNSGSEEKIDTVSLFVSYGYTPSAKFQKVTSINSSTGVVTWGDVPSGTVDLSGITEKGVYNFIVSQPAGGESISLTKKEPYTGNFYIRTDNAGDTKWNNYRSRDHQMVYTEFSMSAANTTGDKYSHYFTSWCERGTNIQFCIANDYSSCISDTLRQDVGNPYKNTDEDGTLKSDGSATALQDRYSANVRFMYNETTNKISRAYVGSATYEERKFLILQGNVVLHGDDDEAITDWSPKYALILADKQNWIYERTLKIKPRTRFKLYSNYAQQSVDPDSAQYFRGAYDSNQFTSDDNSVILIDGAVDADYQMARVIYDFKTNRLMTAWIPSGSNISGDMAINADVLVEREHQEPAQYITFANEDSKLSGVKTVYGAMKFNRWILNNRQNSSDDNPNHGKTAEQIATHHAPLQVGQQKSIYERSLYFISFPFDVNASDIFGFGHYWDEWYLEYYDGETRAKNGYWKDSPPNWKYVMPSMLNDFVLKANEGYILGLDLDYMQADNFDFWSNGISTVELFFPSTASAGTLQQTNCTIPALSAIEGDPYRCTINRGTTEGDRRVKDSYWRCLGVPSFNIYNTSLYDGDGNAITWRPDGNTLPFIYAWNKADNTLTAQSTNTFTFLPMHAYLVQNGGEIRWTNVSAKSSIVARRANEQPQKEYNWDLTLVCDSQLIDRTYIRMSNLEQVTDSFDFGQDLNKEFNSNRSDIYTYIGYEKVAANSMPIQTEQTTIVAVGVKINTAGDYTFAMPEGTYGVGVTLIDTETGVRTHLGLMDYTVTLAKGDYTNRFILEISPVSNTPTDIELINGENGDASLNGVRKVLIDNKLFLIKGDKVYDATGRCIN